jgi:hypothetical protein
LVRGLVATTPARLSDAAGGARIGHMTRQVIGSVAPGVRSVASDQIPWWFWSLITDTGHFLPDAP